VEVLADKTWRKAEVKRFCSGSVDSVSFAILGMYHWPEPYLSTLRQIAASLSFQATSYLSEFALSEAMDTTRPYAVGEQP